MPEERFHRADIVSQQMIDARETHRKEKASAANRTPAMEPFWCFPTSAGCFFVFCLPPGQVCFLLLLFALCGRFRFFLLPPDTCVLPRAKPACVAAACIAVALSMMPNSSNSCEFCPNFLRVFCSVVFCCGTVFCWQIERAEKEREARKKEPQDDGVEYVDFDGESVSTTNFRSTCVPIGAPMCIVYLSVRQIRLFPIDVCSDRVAQASAGCPVGHCCGRL